VKAKLDIYHILFWTVAIVFITTAIMLGTPVFGSMNADNLFIALGCNPPGFADMRPCYWGPLEVSWRFTVYYMPIIGIFASPVAFLYGFFDFTIVCILLLYLLKYLSKREKSKETNSPELKEKNGRHTGQSSATKNTPYGELRARTRTYREPNHRDF